MRCVILVNLSTTTTRIESCPSLVRGRWVMKSILTLSHGSFGMGRGFKSPAAFWLLALLDWQVWQDCTKCLTSLLTHGHQKVRLTSSLVLSAPTCPTQGGEWHSCMIACLTTGMSGMTKRPSLRYHQPFLWVNFGVKGPLLNFASSPYARRTAPKTSAT